MLMGYRKHIVYKVVNKKRFSFQVYRYFEVRIILVKTCHKDAEEKYSALGFDKICEFKKLNRNQ